MIKINVDIQRFYAGLYAEYILDAGLNGFDIATAMLAVLPGGSEYNHVIQKSDTEMLLQIGNIDISISQIANYPDVVSITIGDDSAIVWDVPEVENMLYKHAVFPQKADMLTLAYLDDWNQHVQSATLSDDAWTQAFVILLDTRLAYRKEVCV